MTLSRYDIKVLTIIAVLSVSVLVLMLGLNLAFGFPVSTYYTLPLGWFIGAMMVWAYGKFQHDKALKVN